MYYPLGAPPETEETMPEPRFPDLTVKVSPTKTHQSNRARVIGALQAAGYHTAVVEFINDVARETQGRIHRSRWMAVAERYVHLSWED